MRRHRQSYEMLPRGVPAGRREPASRVVGMLIVVVLLTVAVALAAWTLMTQPAATTAEGSATSSTTTSATVAPTPAQVTETREPPRTIQASGMATIPESLLLPHETDTAWSGANLSLDTCVNTDPERGIIDAATDIRTIYTRSDTAERSESVVVAADDAEANLLYDRLARAMSNCDLPTLSHLPGPVTGRASMKQLMDDGRHLDTDWDRAAIYAVGFPGAESDEPDVGSYLLLARSGRALIVGSASGQDFPMPVDGGVDAAAAASLQEFADAMAAQMCVFKVAGCGPFPTETPPPVFPAGSVQLPDGTVMLPDGQIVQADGLPLGATPTPDDAPQ